WLFGTLRFPGRDSLLPPRTLVAVTFDESDFEAAYEVGAKKTYDGPNQIYTVLLGDVVRPGAVESEAYTHYSLLRTAEENFGLGTLGKNDADSNWMRFLWGKRFAWGEPAQTPLRDCVAVASLGDALHVVQEAGDGELVHRVFDGSGWGAQEPVPAHGFSPALSASSDGSLLLALVRPGGAVAALSFRPGCGWDQQDVAVVGEGDAVALAACNRGADLMCVWRAPGGELWSRRRRGESWEDPVATGRTAPGGFALQALGHVLLLVAAAADGELACATYGTADFNVTTLPYRRRAGPYDDAVKDAWSPDAFPVAHFGAAASPLTPGEPEPRLRPYRSAGPFALAELDGVVSLVHPSHAGTHLATTTFSIAGVLTSKLPVSYKASDETTTSNGYGTLAEAGWSAPRPIAGTRWDGGKVLVMACRGAELVLLHQPGPGCAVLMSRGRYA
ncbi:MAG: alkaline phosphatase family protein, partial [Actinobacteria bacterium]|nr:alkaline phosphatase family protein [Actinomycetota bacterium]